jgi:large subunit ribosomal protein L9
MAKRVQVVLNADVLSLGKDGDLVEVAPGYARNYLLPQRKAVPVTPAVMRQVEARRAKEAARQAALKAEAEAFRTALITIGRFTVKKQTGGDDVLFGTVTNGDVASSVSGTSITWSAILRTSVSPSVTTAIIMPLRALTSCILLMIFS